MFWKKREQKEGRARFLVIGRKWALLGAAAVCALAIFAVARTPAVVSASAAARQLPIYCVERDQKMCSISFDAAWGDGRVRLPRYAYRRAFAVARAADAA